MGGSWLGIALAAGVLVCACAPRAGAPAASPGAPPAAGSVAPAQPAAPAPVAHVRAAWGTDSGGEVDTDAASELENVFRREGMVVYTNTRLIGARRTAQSKSVIFHHQDREVTLTAEEILFALGRIPNTDLYARFRRRSLYHL